MSDSNTYFTAMAQNNALSNLRLLKACEALPHQEFLAPRSGFFPSIMATLNHILTVDWYYIDALEGGTLGLAAFSDDEPFKEALTLHQEQRKCDARLLALCTALDRDGLSQHVVIRRSKGNFYERVDSVLLHLFQHQIHHRGQVHAMLSGTSVPPPQVDEFFLEMDAQLRCTDLDVLGFINKDDYF